MESVSTFYCAKSNNTQIEYYNFSADSIFFSLRNKNNGRPPAIPNANVYSQTAQTFFILCSFASLNDQTRKSTTINNKSIMNAEDMLLANMPLNVSKGCV